MGGDVDGEAPGAYALFSDVAKAHGKVLREGLYLALCSMGVTGAMWHVIMIMIHGQEWLNNADVDVGSVRHARH